MGHSGFLEGSFECLWIDCLGWGQESLRTGEKLVLWDNLTHGCLFSCDFSVCSCALQRDLLLHGRLYISPNWLCFHASLFGKDIKVVMMSCCYPGRPLPRDGLLSCGHASSHSCPSVCSAHGEACHWLDEQYQVISSHVQGSGSSET